MLNLTEIATDLHDLIAWQDTPEILDSVDYFRIIVRALKRFFVDINHPEEFSRDKFITGDEETFYDREFTVTEEEYIKILCRIEFFGRVQTGVNDAFGYSTDALTVTNADKPYANLKDTLVNLQNERVIVFNKMITYTLGE